jgi:hypothetical protein
VVLLLLALGEWVLYQVAWLVVLHVLIMEVGFAIAMGSQRDPVAASTKSILLAQKEPIG